MEPNLDFPRLSVSMRWILLPIMLVWWGIQFICLSCFGGILSTIVAILDLFQQIGTKKEDRDWNNTWTIFSAPFVYPVVWWIRYYKFGEYNNLE